MLVKKVKLTIFKCDHKDIEPKEGGQKIVNYNCSGLTENGEKINFSSPFEFDSHDVEAYDAELAEEVTLKISEWDGKTKYRALK